MTPAVSVCIPTYNGERFISQAIESVLAQTFRDFELVVVDDASTDETLQRVSTFSDPRIRVIRNDRNLGLAGNWNKAVESCTAPIVKLLCHDDLLYPESLRLQLAAMADPNVALVSARRRVINESGKVIIRSRGAKAGRLPGQQMIRNIVRSGTNPLGEPSAVLFRRAMHKQVGGFLGDRPYMIDVDFYCRLLELGDSVALPEVLCAFRIWGSALSSRLASSQARQAREFFKDVQARHPELITAADLRSGRLRAAAWASARRLLYWRVFQKL